MPRSIQTAVGTASLQAPVPAEPEPSPKASLSDSGPQDWSELGRRVLAAALRQAGHELAQRDELPAAPVVPRSRREAGK